MEYNKIIAISGKSGLYEILSQTKNRVIVKSLIDGKRMPITSTQNVSLLENIAVYSYSGEVPLSKILIAIFKKEQGAETISHKESDDRLKSFFEEILPDYDNERVYASNIKKIIQWYNLLVKSEFDFIALKKDTNEEEE